MPFLQKADRIVQLIHIYACQGFCQRRIDSVTDLQIIPWKVLVAEFLIGFHVYPSLGKGGSGAHRPPPWID